MARSHGLQWLCVVLFCIATATASHAQTEQVLYNFAGSPDGSQPSSSLTMYNGNFYGTTYSGGLGYGTVYELSPNGSGGWTETILYSFCQNQDCTDGQNPTYSYVIFDNEGNLYGTAYSGGNYGYGVVFELTPTATAPWNETVLYNFANSPDAANPSNGLIMDSAGNLYGIAFAGGDTNGNGCVFELSPSGGTWTENVIYNINSTYAGLTLGPTGNIYGTTYGSVFQLTPNGAGGWTPTVLYTFNSADSATEGSNPVGTLVLDSSGNLYGTTEAGGTNNAGVVFKLTPQTTGDWKETLLFSFGGTAQFGANGATPFAGIVFDSSGNIYGTTQAGGKYGDGTVYELVAPASGKGAYKEHVVFNFNGEDGAQPESSLIVSSGYLYGTTYGGGSNGLGTVFQANAYANVTKTTLTSSPNPSTQGEAVTFTATVTSSAGPPPNGEIVLFDKIGSAPLVDGVATFTTSQLPKGSIDTAAVYYGDINFTPSNSPRLLQVVQK
jgi:uncharacterized repeat protein (TIGR03803 family)